MHQFGGIGNEGEKVKRKKNEMRQNLAQMYKPSVVCISVATKITEAQNHRIC